MPESSRTITLDTPLSVLFRHRVTFTRGVFSVTNPTLRSVFDLATQATTTDTATRRVVAFIDSNVLAAHPSMPDDIRAYMTYAAGVSQAAKRANIRFLNSHWSKQYQAANQPSSQ